MEKTAYTVAYTCISNLYESSGSLKEAKTEEDRRTLDLIRMWKPINGHYFLKLSYNPDTFYAFVPCNTPTQIRWNSEVDLGRLNFDCPCDEVDCSYTLFNRLSKESIMDQTRELVEIIKREEELGGIHETDLSELADYIGPMEPLPPSFD